MNTLSRELRKTLERVVAQARDVAEEAAAKSLSALAVGAREPHRGMSMDDKALRNRLRAHGRQLGDRRTGEDGTQATDRLVGECAYEQWHRMLFARFLAENQLLLEPESGDVYALEEVQQLARTQGKDWVTLAGEFAVQMLPQVFRQDNPVLKVHFAPEDAKQLNELLEALPTGVFTASDSLGWTYQFWQAKRKDEVNASGNKIGAEELPSVTQLFTEDYMVDFLLDNTLGAWHAGKVLAAHPKLAECQKSEADLRQAVALPGCPWEYLRFMKDSHGKWTPAAGTFDGWPESAAALRCLDPCMGSGHFVVAMFERLVALRLAEGKLDEAATVSAVIRDNLFGLEIDPRCTQIGAFNLALAAWRRVGHCPLPAMNLACSGLAPNIREADWLAIAGDNEKLQRGMERLYRLFQQAAVLGSLINPRAGKDDLFVAAFDELQPLLERAMAQETQDDATHEMAVTARGLARAAEILAGQFTLVATNVPYLARGKQDDLLKEHCEKNFPLGKADLATCFVERCLAFCGLGGTSALVSPQNWLYQDVYSALRAQLLRQTAFDSVAKLGPGAFGAISGEVVTVALVSVCRRQTEQSHSIYFIEAPSVPDADVKAKHLREGEGSRVGQSSQLANPDALIGFVASDDTPALNKFASFSNGLQTGDYPRFSRCFWELASVAKDWSFFQTTVKKTALIDGLHFVVFWEDGDGVLAHSESSVVRGTAAWGKVGVAVSAMGALQVTLYSGQLYDDNTVVVSPREERYLPAVWAYCESDEYASQVRRLDQSLKVRAPLVKVPFDLAHWQKVAAEKYPHGLPKPFSSDSTQWLFNGHPVGADQPLHVAVARLIGYQWPRQTGSSFPDCPALGPDGLEMLADNDGIVPISPTKGEGPATERLRELLDRAYNKDWSAFRQEELLAQVDYAGASLEDWLRDGFFEQHCKLFHNRPFLWHIWDGERDGFHALVNYHKLAASNGGGRDSLKKLTFAYLGDWIARQKAEQSQGTEGADAKLAAALHLQDQLKQIIEGEPPFDLFVRWKPLHEQPQGWDPDISDGVRMNIRPFMMARTLRGKSIFRKEPKMKWGKDRGKEPERPKRKFPWLWSWDGATGDFEGGKQFDGNRWNDLHYSVQAKRDARASHDTRAR